MFLLLLRFLHFWQENDVTNFVPKFGFANMGYLMSPFERAFRVLNDMEMSGSVFYSLAQIRFYIYSEICLVKNLCPPAHCMLAI